jgi:hypothetical protein
MDLTSQHDKGVFKLIIIQGNLSGSSYKQDSPKSPILNPT